MPMPEVSSKMILFLGSSYFGSPFGFLPVSPLV